MTPFEETPRLGLKRPVCRWCRTQMRHYLKRECKGEKWKSEGQPRCSANNHWPNFAKHQFRFLNWGESRWVELDVIKMIPERIAAGYRSRPYGIPPSSRRSCPPSQLLPHCLKEWGVSCPFSPVQVIWILLLLWVTFECKMDLMFEMFNSWPFTLRSSGEAETEGFLSLRIPPKIDNKSVPNLNWMI